MMNVKDIISPLKANKEKWAYTPLTKKKEYLQCIINRAADWGVMTSIARAHVLARKMDPDLSSHASGLLSIMHVTYLMMNMFC